MPPLEAGATAGRAPLVRGWRELASKFSSFSAQTGAGTKLDKR
jgi:hypothetical protein